MFGVLVVLPALSVALAATVIAVVKVSAACLPVVIAGAYFLPDGAAWRFFFLKDECAMLRYAT
jgi:hypothetical protein